jgi:hypothetical protein
MQSDSGGRPRRVRALKRIGFTLACGLTFAASLACHARQADNQTASATPTSVVVNVCQTNPSPYAASLTQSDFGYRQLSMPQAGDTVTSPLIVSGLANPFEGAFSVTIVNASGQTIVSRDFLKDNTSLSFMVQVPYTVTSTAPACVWVHERSGKDGSPVNITQVPVLLAP